MARIPQKEISQLVGQKMIISELLSAGLYKIRQISVHLKLELEGSVCRWQTAPCSLIVYRVNMAIVQDTYQLLYNLDWSNPGALWVGRSRG